MYPIVYPYAWATPPLRDTFVQAPPLIRWAFHIPVEQRLRRLTKYRALVAAGAGLLRMHDCWRPERRTLASRLLDIPWIHLLPLLASEA